MKYVEIAKDFFLIRSSESDFHRNIYLKRFRKDGQSVNLVMASGTRLDADNLISIFDMKDLAILFPMKFFRNIFREKRNRFPLRNYWNKAVQKK